MKPTKTCGDCKEEKPLDEFSVRKAARNGRQGYCKECAKRRALKHGWERQGIDMTPELRDMMEDANEGRCAVCNRTPEEIGKKLKALGVDHDHTSKRTRNLLCEACNLAIGLFDEDPDRMRTAADYVEFYYASEVLDPSDPRPLDDAKARPAVKEFLDFPIDRRDIEGHE